MLTFTVNWSKSPKTLLLVGGRGMLSGSCVLMLGGTRVDRATTVLPARPLRQALGGRPSAARHRKRGGGRADHPGHTVSIFSPRMMPSWTPRDTCVHPVSQTEHRDLQWRKFRSTAGSSAIQVGAHGRWSQEVTVKAMGGGHRREVKVGGHCQGR